MKNDGAISPLSYVSSWRGAEVIMHRKKFTYLVTTTTRIAVFKKFAINPCLEPYQSADSQRFWRLCITLDRYGFLDFIHLPIL
jgi:hypothetical protein